MRAPTREAAILFVKKFALLVIGVAITHFGVALSMIPDIGIGAYDAFGLTVSYVSGVDVGIIYAAMSGFFLLGQIVIERKRFRLTELFQLVFVFGSGFFTAIFTEAIDKTGKKVKAPTPAISSSAMINRSPFFMVIHPPFL